MGKQNIGLGKGFSALFTETEDTSGQLSFDIPVEKVEIPTDSRITILNISDVYPNPNQPRKKFDGSALNDLADSIKKHGVIQPIVVSKTDVGYMIIAGERRYRASKIAGLETIPTIIRNYEDRQIKEIALIENLQREDLNPIEAATAMKLLMDEFKLTQEELAERIGKSRSVVANTIRLLNLSPTVKEYVMDNKLTAGHGRALVTLPQAEQDLLAAKIITKSMSVREVEKAVKDFFNPPEEKPQRIPRELSVELKDLISRMQRSFGTKVSAIGNDRKGRIYIDYYTRDDLDRLCEILDCVEKHKTIVE